MNSAGMIATLEDIPRPYSRLLKTRKLNLESSKFQHSPAVQPVVNPTRRDQRGLLLLRPMRQSWWKILATVLVFYAIIGGLMMPAPARFILNETIRNLYFHVPMWFGMIALFTVSCFYAVRYLRTAKPADDIRSFEFLKVGILFSILGMLTGMEWAQYTWGAAWSNDPKQLTTAVCMLTYFAYLVLRGGMKDEEKKARISAVYNVFAFALMIPLLFVLPRLVDSLHPGNGGNPAFSNYDLDSTMRLVFYPAVLGWTLLGVWMATQRIRLAELQRADEMAQFDFQKGTLHHA